VTLDPQVGTDAHPAPVVERQAEALDHRVRLHSCGPHEQACVELGAVAQSHPTVHDLLEPRLEVKIHTSLDKQIRDVAAECSRDVRQDGGRRVDEHPPLGDVAQGGVVPEGVVAEVAQLGESLDAGIPAPHEDEREMLRTPSVVRLHRSGLEEAQQLIAKVEGVEDGAATHRVVGQPGNWKSAGHRPHRHHDVVEVDA
jgi:hypothetical protein